MRTLHFGEVPTKTLVWRVSIEFLVTNNLSISNIDNCKHTFIKINKSGAIAAKRFPDRTFVNPIALIIIRYRQVVDIHKFSDHKFIEFSLQTTPLFSHTTQIRYKIRKL